MAQLIERVVALLNRLNQADAFTLTSRLKRQHLQGADVAHLSRTTVNNVLAEAAGLRLQFRALLEDDKIVTTCNRKDLRSLFNLFRDLFAAMGEMRVTLNEVILDPSIAPKISELSLNPSMSVEGQKERDGDSHVAAAGWMGPISKLFGSPSVRPGERGSPALTRSLSGKGPARPQRFVPKLGPALSASATTVNVEFSGAGVGRAVTSTSSPHSARPGPSTQQATSSGQSFMGIFAGAPRSTTPDPWVVVPKGERPPRAQTSLQNVTTSTPLRRSQTRHHPNRMSRNVDAILDLQNTSVRVDQESEEPDYLGPLLEHKLRRRGLSDSSIHSTFMAQGPDDSGSREGTDTPQRETGWADRESVLQALSRKVQNFRLGPTASGTSSESGVSPGGSSSVESREGKTQSSGQGFGTFIPIPGLSHWTTTGMSEPSYSGPDAFFGSPTRVDESGYLERTQRQNFY